MIKVNKLFKCDGCKGIAEIIGSNENKNTGMLSCCGKPMSELKENTNPEVSEKHIPVIEKLENGIKIKIGAKEHPSIPEHYIEWIEVITENNIYRKNLKPGDKPEAVFDIKENNYTVRAYCNIHGLWRLDV